MILKELYNYYQLHSSELPAFGKELKQIGFILVIDKDGEFIRFEDRRLPDKKSADSFLVAKSVGRTAAPKPNHLYDNSSYILCFSDKSNIDPLKYYNVFKESVLSIAERNPENADIEALRKFFNQDVNKKLAKMQADNLWPEIEKSLTKKYAFFSFRIEGDNLILAEKEDLIKMACQHEDIAKANSTSKGKRCLITGDKGNIVETSTATMIPGSQATAKLVTFQVKSGYDSYGKMKGENAPIGEEAEFCYSTALNKMLGKDSRNKFTIGTRTFLFWASSGSEAGKEMEDCLFSLLGIETTADPDKNLEAVKQTFSSIFSGKIPSASDDRFFIMGVSPNSARIAVNYWAEIPLKSFAQNILTHFNDFSIIDTRKDKKPYGGIRSILSAVTLGGKASEATPNLPEAIVKSIFQNLPYPASLFGECIRRIRAEQKVYITRAAILKAYLNRIKTNQIKLNEMLDKNNSNPGYLSGRLFAAIEKIQSDANGINSVKERYLNSVSSTPAAIFPTLLNLSVHHSEKLATPKAVYFEKLKQEIINKFDPEGFPVQLSLQDQGRFFVGYYHQMQDFYTPKQNEN